MNDQLNNSSSASLTRLIAADAADAGQWTEDDHRGMIEHQLASPLTEELLRVLPQAAVSIEKANASTDNPPDTFANLFETDSPSIELLLIVKNYAKAVCNAHDGSLPKRIALAVYYLAIATALVKHNQLISTTDRAEIDSGLRWGVQQNWLPQSANALFTQAAAALRSLD